MNVVPQEQVQSLGLNNPLQRPPFESLPSHVQEFVNGLDGLEPTEQLNLIHQFTQSTIKYEPAQNEATDVPQNFAQTLASPKGDCDDIAIFEAGLVQYANEQGVAHFDDVVIAGGDIAYQYKDSAGEAKSADLSHNFVVASEKGQIYLLDANAPHVGSGDVEGGGFNSSLLDSTGGTVDAHVFIKNLEVAQNVTDGSVNISPEISLQKSEPDAVRPVPVQAATPGL